MRKKVLKKLHMITLHPAAFPAPLRPCHPGWEKPMSMLTSNRIRNLPFCEEMNTSLGYGTMHQNCLRMIKLFCFIVVISNKFTTSLSYFLWSSAKWFFCTFDEGFPPDTSYYFFGNFVVETFLMKNLLKNRFYPFNHTLLKTILHKVSERFLALTSILMDWLLRKSHFFGTRYSSTNKKIGAQPCSSKTWLQMNKSAKMKIIQVCKIKEQIWKKKTYKSAKETSLQIKIKGNFKLVIKSNQNGQNLFTKNTYTTTLHKNIISSCFGKHYRKSCKKNFLAQPIFFCQNEFLFCCSPPYRQIRCLYITL